MSCPSEAIEFLLLFPLSLKGCNAKNAYKKMFLVLGIEKEYKLHTSHDYAARYHWVYGDYLDFVLVEESPGVFSELLFALAPDRCNLSKWSNSCYFSVKVINNKICLKELKNKYNQIVNLIAEEPTLFGEQKESSGQTAYS